MKYEIVMLLAIATGVAFIGVSHYRFCHIRKKIDAQRLEIFLNFENRILYLERENDKLRSKVNDLTVRMISPIPPESELGPEGVLNF